MSAWGNQVEGRSRRRSSGCRVSSVPRGEVWEGLPRPDKPHCQAPSSAQPWCMSRPPHKSHTHTHTHPSLAPAPPFFPSSSRSLCCVYRDEAAGTRATPGSVLRVRAAPGWQQHWLSPKPALSPGTVTSQSPGGGGAGREKLQYATREYAGPLGFDPRSQRAQTGPSTAAPQHKVSPAATAGLCPGCLQE